MNIRTACFSILAALTTTVASSQTVHLLDVKVSDLKESYQLGEKITLTPLAPPPSSLHVRVFFDTIRNLKAYVPDKTHCVRYNTTILWGVGYPNSINLEALQDQGMVHIGPQGATVTLVFEDIDQPEPGSFGLKPDSVANYFRYAFEIHIAPTETQVNLNRKVSQKIQEEVRESTRPFVSPSIAPQEASEPQAPPCFKVDPRPETLQTENESPAAINLVATASPVVCEDLPAPMSPEAIRRKAPL